MIISRTAIAFVIGMACAPAIAVVVPIQTIQFTEESFDKSNFSQMTSITARKQAEELLNASIELIGSVTELSEPQKEKLHLAGEVDIQRFFSEYDEIKRSLQFGSISRDVWQEQFTQSRREVQPLLAKYATGLHGEGSLFEKTLRTCLNAGQLQATRVQNEARQRAIYGRNIALALATIDRTVPLTREQRTKMTKIMVMNTDPPEVYGVAGRLVFQIVGRMSLVADELKPLFSDKEWKVIAMMIDVGKVNSQ